MKLKLSIFLMFACAATTIAQKPCEELAIGEETIIPGEDYLHWWNAKQMTNQVLERDRPGNAYRGFHPKTIGCLSGTFTVYVLARGGSYKCPNCVLLNHFILHVLLISFFFFDTFFYRREDLPEDLQVGLFMPGKQYGAFGRLSHVTPIYPPDSIGDAMELGKSIGLILDGVPGKKLQPAYEDSDEFHFLMNSAEEFWCADMECAASLFANIRRSKNRPTIPSDPDNIFAQVMEFAGWSEEFNATVGRILAENAYGSSQGHVGAISLWTQAPFAYGPGRAAKFELIPCNENFNGMSLEDPAAEDFDPNFMTTRLQETQSQGDYLCYKLNVYFQEDTCAQPIEDASVKWSTIENAQTLGEVLFTSDVMTDEDPKCRNAVFQPYIKTEEFRPLGGLNRARLYAYEMIGQARQSLNGYRTAPHGALPGGSCPFAMPPEGHSPNCEEVSADDSGPMIVEASGDNEDAGPFNRFLRKLFD